LAPSPPALAFDEFWRDIPVPLAHLENSTRLMVNVLPFLMPLEPRSRRQRLGLALYGIGLVLCCGAWTALILAPHSAWATAPIGFMAPAYTPLLRLVGIALLGQRLYWGRRYRWWMFLVPTAGFLVAHVAHAARVYART
jgi:hypothetical protein